MIPTKQENLSNFLSAEGDVGVLPSIGLRRETCWLQAPELDDCPRERGRVSGVEKPSEGLVTG